MEKYSQFRDRGSGISPFIPVSSPTSALSTVLHFFIFVFRLPFFLTLVLLYFAVLHHLPLPVVVRKLLLWVLLGIPGIWWVDLQLDGVKRGSLSQQPPSRVPHPRSVIAASFTSPIDALYLAAIFDPVFAIGYPAGSRKVRRVGLATAMWHALSPAQLAAAPASSTGHTDLRALLDAHPDRVIVVFPECATTNGKGILPFGAALAAVPPDVRVFPVSVRYTPPDVTTPVPGAWFAFLWKLLSRPAHGVRVRIAEGMYNTSQAGNGEVTSGDAGASKGALGDLTLEEQRFLDRIAEALARLGRNKRVGLTVKDKERFVQAWNRRKK